MKAVSKRMRKGSLAISRLKNSLLFIMAIFLANCTNNEDPDGNNIPDPDPDPDTSIIITVDPATSYQEMIGFGGALTWYCDRVTSSSKKGEILDLMVNDLGADIIRLKNWYYPLNYPTNKVPDQMEPTKEWFKQHFDATDELYELIKSRNQNTKILFSSWGPPSALKSNSNLNEGTLKKEDGKFVYGQFATYWEDVLDNISFNPDYISIQNEPNYVNAGWETCEWAAFETFNLPGYENALDTIYEKIKDRSNLPVIIAPESANLSTNSFQGFADRIKDKPYVGAYAYHPYNLNESSTASNMVNSLKPVGDNYSDKPNLMTEFSGMSWLKTSQLIHHVLKFANSSAYIYWELMWAPDSDNAMIQVDGSGNYTLTPFYYLIKHYAKHVDEGYLRIDVSSSDSGIDVVAFKSPDNSRLTLILINTKTTNEEVKFDVGSAAVTAIAAWQSKETELYTELTDLSIDEALLVKSKSITTVTIDF